MCLRPHFCAFIFKFCVDLRLVNTVRSLSRLPHRSPYVFLIVCINQKLSVLLIASCLALNILNMAAIKKNCLEFRNKCMRMLEPEL